MSPPLKLEKMYIRSDHPNFLDLPWEYHLDDWGKHTDRIVEVEKGRSRHTVVFVHYKSIYAIKELPDNLAHHEYSMLKTMEDLELPAVKPVGYVSIKDRSTGQISSIVITVYLKSSLPYRSIFMRSDLLRYQGKLLDALAVLLVTLHLKQIYWGDVSLSNVLFRRDAGELQAYFVDAETSEIHPTLSDSKREYELDIMEENLAGELIDLSQLVSLPDGFDIFEVGSKVRAKYLQLWEELTSDETIHRHENYKINEKIERINQLGFTVDEIEMRSTGTSDEVIIRPKVTDRNYHQDRFQSLTGFSTEENIAKQLLSEIYEIKADLTYKRKREVPLSNAAFYWSSKNFYPMVNELDLMDDTDTALQTYSEILEIRRKLSKREGRDVSTDEAITVYKKQTEFAREQHLFKRGIRRHRTDEDDRDPRRLSLDWKRRVFYQIYPRSFYDTDANGVGDIPGIIEKLDYLKWLGISGIRINSIFPSPMDDMGYDITYFKGVDPEFGTIEDFDELVSEAHTRDIKVILDIIPNHTSIQHPWFVESKKSRDNSKRDWYIWHEPGPDGGPPTNWLSITGESAWTFDEQTGEYYLHSFLKTEPDLNWANEDLRKKMLDVFRFWLEHDVDGIMIIMLSWLAKDRQFRDDPTNPNYDPKTDFAYNANIPIFSYDRPELLDYVSEIASVLDEYEGRISLAEIDQFSPISSYLEDYSVAKLIDIPVNIRLIDLEWNATEIKEFVDQYDRVMGDKYWPNYLTSTHDFPRLVNRIGIYQARIAAVLLMTLRGIPSIYYGQEIGMSNVPIPKSHMRDPWEKISEGSSRDPQRSPMQWDHLINAGFTLGKPWLPISSNLDEVNVNTQTYRYDSLLNLYRSLLDLRKQFTSLVFGSYHSYESPHPDCYLFCRQYQSEQIMVILNFGEKYRKFDLKSYKPDILLLTSYMDQENVYLDQSYHLRPNEGIVILLDKSRD